MPNTLLVCLIPFSCSQAAAIGVMYLSTMAGALDPAELAMYAALLMDSDNSEMIEFLMAGMWILLRNPDNRKVGVMWSFVSHTCVQARVVGLQRSGIATS
jgi:hypothetical protein